MKSLDRIIAFTDVKPIDTMCGKVYALASTDLFDTTPLITVSFALAHQIQHGGLHVHHKTREVYICVDGEGFVGWGSDHICTFKKHDALDIAPGTFHSFNTAPHELIEALVVSYPKFTPTDEFKVADTARKRTERKPPFYISGATHQTGILASHPPFIVSRLHVPKKPYVAHQDQLLFVVSGTGIFKGDGLETTINRYDSIAIQKGESIHAVGPEHLSIIVVQV